MCVCVYFLESKLKTKLVPCKMKGKLNFKNPSRVFFNFPKNEIIQRRTSFLLDFKVAKIAGWNRSSLLAGFLRKDEMLSH